jgi:hypothetical protein
VAEERSEPRAEGAEQWEVSACAAGVRGSQLIGQCDDRGVTVFEQ